ncbi:MAG TPA: DUF192 domain-containing protein [Candidatus Acidoferrales bacterium]|nr:DUF192 domain-containing protein [Candidatus Acidoferrales bacterium]
MGKPHRGRHPGGRACKIALGAPVFKIFEKRLAGIGFATTALRREALRALSFPFLCAALACSPKPRVVITTEAAKEVTISVEVADTPAKRARGLMYRNDLGEAEGMLFLFPAAERQTFWMKNTPLSLDLIFIGSDFRIVGIVARATPFSTAALSVPAPSQFVLEVRGGFSERHGVKAGDRVRFEGVSLAGVKS